MKKTPLKRKREFKRAPSSLRGFRPSNKIPRYRFIDKKRKGSTGELALFIELYHKRGGVSELSGKPLLPPGHPKFYHQGSHGLNKGMYPEWRLREENIWMMLPEEHDQWHNFGNKDELIVLDPRWKPIVEAVRKLKIRANRGEKFSTE
jgi:hypothetical protein